MVAEMQFKRKAAFAVYGSAGFTLMKTNLKNMTDGSPGKLIFRLALPLMFGNMFQQLYTMVDAMIVGRGVGVNALAAMGAADWINWLVLGIVTGFTQGFSILFAQKFGAKDFSGLRRILGVSATISLIIGILMTAAGILVARPALIAMKTPPQVINDSLSYLYVIYSGTIVVMAYNLTASLLRALGDGKTPLVAMIIACFINIVLDLLFVMVFRWGIPGAAAATVIAQFFSFIFCIVKIRKIEFLRVSKSDFKPDKITGWELLRLGTPVSFQNAVIGVGGIVVQSVINGYGLLFIAGFTATNKLYGLLEMAAISFGYSMTTYMGQNFGAKRLDRIKQGMRTGVIMAVAVSLVISAVVFLFGRSIVGLFVSPTAENATEVIRIAYTYFCTMGAGLSILYLLHMYRSALQGLGDTLIPMVSGIAELVMRIAVILTAPALIGEWGLYLAEPAAWLGAAVILIIAYYMRVAKMHQTLPLEVEANRI